MNQLRIDVESGGKKAPSLLAWAFHDVKEDAVVFTQVPFWLVIFVIAAAFCAGFLLASAVL